MTELLAVEFGQLAGADLILDRVYRGGSMGGTGDDPLSRLLPVGKQGGFRQAGSTTRDAVKLVVLYTTGAEPDWPDTLTLRSAGLCNGELHGGNTSLVRVAVTSPVARRTSSSDLPPAGKRTRNKRSKAMVRAKVELAGRGRSESSRQRSGRNAHDHRNLPTLDH